MDKYLPALISILLICFLLPTHCSADSSEQALKLHEKYGLEESDYKILMVLYESLHGDNWRNKWGWKEFSDDGIFGVKIENGRVKEINLVGNGLSGRIHPAICGLSELEVLFLGLNEITGEIPEEIGRLKKLDRLLLNNNCIKGETESVNENETPLLIN